MGFKLEHTEAGEGCYDFAKGFRLVCDMRSGTIAFFTAPDEGASPRPVVWVRGENRDDKRQLIMVGDIKSLGSDGVTRTFRSFALFLHELYGLRMRVLREDDVVILFEMRPDSTT